MKRLLFPIVLMVLGVMCLTFAFLIKDQHNELLATGGMTARPMRALWLVSRDLTAKATTTGLNPAELSDAIQFRSYLIGAVGVVTGVLGVALPFVFPRQPGHSASA